MHVILGTFYETGALVICSADVCSEQRAVRYEVVPLTNCHTVQAHWLCGGSAAHIIKFGTVRE